MLKSSIFPRRVTNLLSPLPLFLLIILLSILLIILVNLLASPVPSGEPWKRHTIDDASHGADGVRLMDVNGDGRVDVVTGWEEGGEIRVCLQPEAARIKTPWPAVSVGKVKSPEDAVFADLDGDGAIDVVSSCEGGERTIYMHWAPTATRDYTRSAAWETTAIPAARKTQQWMFCLPMDIDGKHGIDLVVASKNQGASISWLQSPANPRDAGDWKLHPLYKAGWMMSLAAKDLDGDGDQDIVASDRRGEQPGVLWLENPGPAHATDRWRVHRVGPLRAETMFLDIADLDGDGREDILAAVANGGTHFFRRTADAGVKFETHLIPWPVDMRRAKSVRVADIDLDGQQDMVVTAEPTPERAEKVYWLSYKTSPTHLPWIAHRISGPSGEKFDLTELLDLDGDGDMDVLTCEERDDLGVIWYENPTR